MRLLGVLVGLLALAACQPGGGAPERVRGDEIRPGEIEVSGLSHCDSARLELAAVVLNGPPKGESLEDVGDATAPGCTWVAMDGAARVRLNVYDSAMLAGARTHTEQFEALADAHAARNGAGVEVDGIGLRAARFGFSEATPETGTILVETDAAVLEFEGRAVSPAKLAIFARGVSENIAQPEE
jgi:hypothetical protein